MIEACDGRQGLQAYLQHGRAAIAFVFLDLMMPVCDGFHAALGIRSVESRRGWLPVPLVAYTSEDVRRGSPTWLQCMHAGFNDVVVRHDGGERVWVGAGMRVGGPTAAAPAPTCLHSSHAATLAPALTRPPSPALRCFCAAQAHGQAACRAAAVPMAARPRPAALPGEWQPRQPQRQRG